MRWLIPGKKPPVDVEIDKERLPVMGKCSMGKRIGHYVIPSSKGKLTCPLRIPRLTRHWAHEGKRPNSLPMVLERGMRSQAALALLAAAHLAGVS